MSGERSPAAYIGEFIRKLSEQAQKEAKRSAGAKNPEEVKKRYLNWLKKISGKDFTADEIKKEKLSAKRWSRRAQTKDPSESVAKAKDERYLDTPIDASAMMETTGIIAQQKGIDIPQWIREVNIGHSKAAAEFASRVSLLPKELQEDPHVIHREAARMYWSVSWRTATDQEIFEIGKMLDDAYSYVSQKIPGISEASFWKSIDPQFEKRFNLYGTRRVDTRESVGTKPAESDPQYEAWQKKRILEIQNNNLNQRLKLAQRDIDRVAKISPNNELETIEALYKELTEGRGAYADTTDMSEAGRQFYRYNSEEVEQYLSRLEGRRTELQRKINENQQKAYGEKVITLGQLRKTDWFLGDELSKTTQGYSDRISYTFGRNWTQQDVEFLLKHGYRKWFYNFADRVFGLGMERISPSLAQQYVWEDIQNFLITVYGNRDASIILTEFQVHWNERSKLDYVIHSLGLGPGDNKRRLEAMSMLQSSDIDYLNTFEHSELAYSFMERETFGLLAEKLEKYEERKVWLKTTIDNPFYTADRKSVVGRLKKIYPDKKTGDIEKVAKLYGKQSLARDEYIQILNAEELEMSPTEFASRGLQALQEEVQLKMDTNARGVILEDLDVWGYADVEIHLVKLSENLAVLENIKKERLLTPEEQLDYEKLQGRKQRLLDKKLAIIHEMDPSLDIEPDQTKLVRYLAERKGLSQIETRVYERMREYLRIKNGVEPDETELRMAIWSARVHIMGTGRMAAIGAMMARSPGTERTAPGMEYKTTSWKHAMRAPAFEDLVRIMNVEMFADRFVMGGKMGDVVRSYLRFNLRNTRVAGAESKTARSFFDTEEWRRLRGEAHDAPTKAAMAIIEFAEKDLGIKFTEILAPGFMSTGAQYDGNAWRLDLSTIDSIKHKLLELRRQGKLPNDAILDNQGLAIRYLIADGPPGRRAELEKMMKRTPTKFFQLLADKRKDMMREANLTTDDKTWYIFENALKYAETDLWNVEKYATVSIDLASQANFDELVKPYLQRLGVAEADVGKYRNLIEILQTKLKTERPTNIEGVYESYLDAIAREKLPLTLSLDDFNWKDTNMAELGNLAFPRRTRDLAAMEVARNVILEFISNRENILSPDDPKETIKKLITLRDAIDEYAGRPVSEPTVKQLTRLFLEFNRDRSLWSLPSFLPGGKGLMTMMAEADLRPDAPYRGPVGRAVTSGIGKVGQFTLGNLAKLSHKIKPLESVLNWMMPGWKHFSHEPFEHWPHSIAEAISWSVRFTGVHGNRWNEQQIDEMLSTIHDMGLFTQHPEFIHDLRGEFKAGLSFKILATARRYWWVVPVATIALAASQSLEEDKGGSSRH